MKILHILPQIRIGGVLTVVFNLAKSQREHHEDVSLYIARPEKFYRDKEPEFLALGCELVFSKYRNLYDPRHMVEIRRLMKQFDIVHVHLFPHQLWASIAYRTLSKNQRPILITTEHNTFNNRRKYPVLRYFDQLLYSPYDMIVSISDQTKINLDKWLRNIRFSKKNVVINNGVDIAAYRNVLKANFPEMSIPIEAKIIVMVSRLSAPKDPHTAVRAIALTNNKVHLIFVGEGEYEKSIKTLARDLGIAERIHLLGLRSDIPSILNSADIGLLSTNWDGFGLVAVEYMAAGLPVIVSDVDGLRDVVGNKKCTFPKGDYRTLASQITQLLSDPLKYQEQKLYSLNRCQEFGVDTTNEKYYQLYSSLLKRKGFTKSYMP